MNLINVVVKERKKERKKELKSMGALKKSWVVFLLFFSYILADDDSSVNLFRSWYNNNSTDLESWDYDDGSTFRPILHSTNPLFSFGFFANGTATNNLFYLVVCLRYSDRRVVWCANREKPVRENATLDFTANRGLELKDADGTLVWFTNTSGHPVSRLNITDEGNLMLVDAKDSAIWQAFGYYYSSVNFFRSWHNSNSSDMDSWDSYDGSTFRPILLTGQSANNPRFRFGFFANRTATNNLFYLVVRDERVVWCANREKPVRENATLDFTANRGLELKDADGTLVWFTNTSGHSVSRLHITDTGNLMLVDAKDSVIWQAFGYYYSSVNFFRSWHNSNSSDMDSWDSYDGSTFRPILLTSESSTNPPFRFGFFAYGTATSNNLFYLVVVSASDDSISRFSSPVVVWCGNSDKPVRENATLDFTAKGGLELKDADGTLVWSTNTSGHSVSRLNITDGGNLMLVDAKDSVIWQAFGYYYSSMNFFRSWHNSNSSDMDSWDDGSTFRPILLTSESSTNPPFGFGFFAYGTATSNNLFYLVVVLTSGNQISRFSSPVVVWCANRDKPVRENATLDFTAKGGLELKDADGTLVWSTETSGHLVRRMNITDGGNLMLLDDKDSVIWQSFDYYSSVNLFRSWYNSDLGSFNFSDGSTIRPILFISNSATNPPFGFGFFANGTRQPGTLDFTAKGGLELKDADGTLVWSTKTSGDPVSRLNITDGGNLMLVDAKNNVIWQSFDYPTDTWLPNQNISFGKGLAARNSSSNLGTGLYSLNMTPDSLEAFLISDPQRSYTSLDYTNFTRLSNNISIEAHSNYARFNLKNITDAGFQFLMLEPTGHLNLYGLYSVSPQNIFSWLSECDYPTACGNYGVCSGNGNCRCPGDSLSYFTPSQVSEPTRGCRRVTSLSCKDKHLHTFLELKNVESFNLEPIYSYMDVESCKRACLQNCTCEAAFHRIGSCYLISQLYSLMDNINSYSSVFIKVQGLPDTSRSPDKKNSSLVPILIPTLSVTIVIILVIAGCYYKIQINLKYNEEEGDDEVIVALKRFSFLELQSATQDFQVRLGRGGFGSVFEGDLNDGTKVAVKLLDSIGQGRKEFLAEVNTIGSIHHFNLARLVGYCAEKSNRLLVYDYMCNGSLDKWIFNPDQARALTWEIRRKIIIGLAKGLEYLHMHCDPSIIHFDIKPQNVLLDGDFNVKISDFGLAKLIDRNQSQVLTVLKGTPGYVAPELFQGTNISVKADVFSFGIVILEVVFEQKNLGSLQSDSLVEIVKEKAEMNQLHDLVDGYNEDMQCHAEEALKMIKIALWCLRAHNRRPSMSTVLKVFEGLMDLESIAEYCLISAPNIEPHFEANSALSTPPVASIVSGPR